MKYTIKTCKASLKTPFEKNNRCFIFFPGYVSATFFCPCLYNVSRKVGHSKTSSRLILEVVSELLLQDLQLFARLGLEFSEIFTIFFFNHFNSGKPNPFFIWEFFKVIKLYNEVNDWIELYLLKE